MGFWSTTGRIGLAVVTFGGSEIVREVSGNGDRQSRITTGIYTLGISEAVRSIANEPENDRREAEAAATAARNANIDAEVREHEASYRAFLDAKKAQAEAMGMSTQEAEAFALEQARTEAARIHALPENQRVTEWERSTSTAVTRNDALQHLREEFNAQYDAEHGAATTPAQIRARDAAWRVEAATHNSETPEQIHAKADQMHDKNAALADLRREFMAEQALRGVTGRDADRAFESFSRRQDLGHKSQEDLERMTTEQHSRTEDVRRVRQAVTARMVGEGVPPNDPRISREVNNFVRAHERDAPDAFHAAAQTAVQDNNRQRTERQTQMQGLQDYARATNMTPQALATARTEMQNATPEERTALAAQWRERATAAQEYRNEFTRLGRQNGASEAQINQRWQQQAMQPGSLENRLATGQEVPVAEIRGEATRYAAEAQRLVDSGQPDRRGGATTGGPGGFAFGPQAGNGNNRTGQGGPGGNAGGPPLTAVERQDANLLAQAQARQNNQGQGQGQDQGMGQGMGGQGMGGMQPQMMMMPVRGPQGAFMGGGGNTRMLGSMGGNVQGPVMMQPVMVPGMGQGMGGHQGMGFGGGQRPNMQGARPSGPPVEGNIVAVARDQNNRQVLIVERDGVNVAVNTNGRDVAEGTTLTVTAVSNGANLQRGQRYAVDSGMGGNPIREVEAPATTPTVVAPGGRNNGGGGVVV